MVQRDVGQRFPLEGKRILYIETGTTGGGSFESMLLNLEYINRAKYTAIAVFLNETPHKKKAEALGIKTYLLNHSFYARQVCYRRRIYRFILRMSARHMPVLYLTLYKIIHRRLIRSLQGIVARHRIDVIHLNNTIVRNLFGVLVSRKTGAACVSHLRAAPVRTGHEKRIARMTNDLVFAYIATSAYMKEQWTAQGVDHKKCHTIHNGIPPLHIDALDVREEFRLGGVQTVVCSVGRFVEWKNQSFLIRGFGEFRRRNPSSALVLVGDGRERANLECLTHDLNVASCVTFVGHSEQAMEILAGSDIFVLPSREEPFGRVTLEAMALKVPVIATKSGGSTEVVVNNETGLLVSLDDVHELCNALQTLSDDRELRERLVRNAYRTTQEKFHIANCVTEIEKLYAAI